MPDDLSGVPPKYAHRYHEAAIYNSIGVFRTVVLPKPSALAFLLAIGLFVRRGDFLRPGTRELIRKLSLTASELLPRAERADVPKELDFNAPFKQAGRILPLQFPDRGTRLALVSEYVQNWCATWFALATQAMPASRCMNRAALSESPSATSLGARTFGNGKSLIP